MRHFQMLVLVLAMFGLAGCPQVRDIPSADSIRIRVQLMDGTTPISTGDIFTTDQGYRVRLDQLDVYLSAFDASNSDGSAGLSSEVALFKLGNDQTTAEFAIPNSGSQTLNSFAVGVPDEYNLDPDPAAYPVDHPLSDFQGMFWTWASGYKFIQLEGRMDLTGTEGAELTDFISIHTGKPENLEIITPSFTVAAECERIEYVVALDVSQWFNAVHNIDIATNNQTHTSDNPELAEQFTDNFAASLTVH